MAKPTIIKYQDFKRGDTQNFVWVFTPPYVGYNWSVVTLDCAMTSVTTPTDNSGAAATRINQTLTVDASNSASYTFALTHAESLTLTPGATYKVEPQLKENGVNYITPITGTVDILQDYIIT